MTENRAQKNKKQTIEQSLELSIIDKNLRDLSIDIVELSIDSLLDDGILKDLPIVGNFVKLYSFGVNVKDKLFLKKIFSFLNQLKNISSKKREQMIKKINSDKKYRIKVGEKLLYILDSCNDYENSERVGILFKYFLEEKITYDEFIKVSNAINKVDNETFNKFLRKGNSVSLQEDVEDFLYLGFVYLDYRNMNINQTKGLSVSDVGKIILKVFKDCDKK